MPYSTASAAISTKERQRVNALKKTGLMNSPQDADFDLVAQVAQRVFGVKIALISFIHGSTQWFKSKVGIELERSPRDIAFCNYTIQKDEVLVVPDTLKDPRFSHNPLVAHSPFIRFYCGIPLHSPCGECIGTLCVLDSSPHEPSSKELSIHKLLAHILERLIYKRQKSYIASHVPAEPLNEVILRAQNTLLRTDNDHLTFKTLLDDILELTGCSFGLIGEVLTSSKNLPFLKVHSLTNISGNSEINALCQSPLNSGMEFYNLNNLLGSAVVKRKIIISNSPPGDTRSGDTPPGHPSIENYTGIPVFSGTLLVGLIGLANRPTGFTLEFTESLSALTTVVGVLIERKRMLKERANYHEQLHFATHHDSLTNLPNRRLLDIHLEQRIRSNNGPHIPPFTVCYFDLDGFKAVNDSYGHHIGDELLRQVAERVGAQLNENDALYRINGDEFAMVLNNINDDSVYQSILKSLGRPFNIGGRNLRLSASMGISTFPNDSNSGHQLLRNADQSMYKAKEKGKNQVCHFDSKIAEELALKSLKAKQVVEAINKKHIALYLQPKVKLNSGEIGGYEVLCRWIDPRRGLIPPADFLPILQNTHALIELDKYMLITSLKKLRMLHKNGIKTAFSVNVSAEFFSSDEFISVLHNELTEFQDISKNLTLEIIESIALGDLELAISRLNAVRALGYQIALDDFGTGYCSLTYFKQLPINEVKIDQSFIRGLLEDHGNKAIIHSIIDLAHQFDRHVVAEGVETAEQALELQSLGCESAQGFYYSKPLPFNEAIALLPAIVH